jgi:hypothetical protein
VEIGLNISKVHKQLNFIPMFHLCIFNHEEKNVIIVLSKPLNFLDIFNYNPLSPKVVEQNLLSSKFQSVEML